MTYFLLFWKWLGSTGGVSPQALAVAEFESRMEDVAVFDTEFESE